jgi:hypothetical protein
MLTTTFRELKEAGACKERYRFLRKKLRKYVLDTPISIKQIIEICGFQDAVWALVHTFDRCDILIELIEHCINGNPWLASGVYEHIFRIYRSDNFKGVYSNVGRIGYRHDGYEHIFSMIANYHCDDNMAKKLLDFCERAEKC